MYSARVGEARFRFSRRSRSGQLRYVTRCQSHGARNPDGSLSGMAIRAGPAMGRVVQELQRKLQLRHSRDFRIVRDADHERQQPQERHPGKFHQRP